jgi:hypothetical protein
VASIQDGAAKAAEKIRKEFKSVPGPSAARIAAIITVETREEKQKRIDERDRATRTLVALIQILLHTRIPSGEFEILAMNVSTLRNSGRSIGHHSIEEFAEHIARKMLA